MIKNRLDFQLAAQKTAQKIIATDTPRAAAATILNDFDELKVDDKYFDEWQRIVTDRVQVFANWAGQQPDGTPLPAAPAAPLPLNG